MSGGSPASTRTRVFPAQSLYIHDGREAERIADGAIRFPPDGHGYALFGPYTTAKDGIYRVKVWGASDPTTPGQSHFEVFDPWADCRLYASRLFSPDFETFVRLYKTEHLEFRFITFGEGLTVTSVELEEVLLDQEMISASALRDLIDRVSAAGGEATALFRLFDRLADLGDVSGAESLRSQYVQTHALASEPRTWDILAGLHELRGASLAADDASLARNQVTEAVCRLTISELDITQLTPVLRTRLAALRYSPELVNATRLHRDYDEPRRLWHDRPLETGRAGEHPVRQPLFERYVDIDRSHQASLARGKGVAAYCPVSGRLLRSCHGFVLNHWDLPFIFYHFEGVETFYLCCGHISNAKLFIYLPRSQSIIWISDPWFRNYSADHLVRTFNIEMACCPDDVVTYLSEPAKPAAVVGSNIYGHFFWASLSGLEWAIETGLSDGLAEVVRVQRQYIDVGTVFPELTDRVTPPMADASEVFRYAVSRRLLPIHFTDVAMSEPLIARLRQLARTRRSAAGRVPPDAPRPLLWINLRAHSKVWLGQKEGYAAILNALYDDYGACGAFIDGLPDCAEIAAQIRALTRPEVVFYDGLSLSFYDTLSWALEVDAYISVISSGLLIVNILADKPGVAHAEHGHLTQMDWWHTIKPGARAPLHPTFEQVTEVTGDLYGDYHLDWRVLLDLTRSILDVSFDRKGRPRKGDQALRLAPQIKAGWSMAKRCFGQIGRER